MTDNFGNHPIVEALAQTRTRVLLRLARSVRTASAAPAGWQTSQLVLGSQESWGETDFAGLIANQDPVPDGADPRGRVPLAVAASKAIRPRNPPEVRQEARIVVFGDVDVATDSYFGSVGNPVLIGNTFNWLVARQQLIEIEGRRPEKIGMTLGKTTTGRWSRWSSCCCPAPRW